MVCCQWKHRIHWTKGGPIPSLPVRFIQPSMLHNDACAHQESQPQSQYPLSTMLLRKHRVSLAPVRQCMCIVWSKTESCTCTHVHVCESFFKLSPYDPLEQPLHVLYKSFGVQRLHCELPFRSSDVVSAARWYKWRSLIPILHAECSHGRVWGARVQGVTLWLHWRGWSGGVYMIITREQPLITCAFLGSHPKTNTEVCTCILDRCGQYCLESLDCPCKPDDKTSVWVGD